MHPRVLFAPTRRLAPVLLTLLGAAQAVTLHGAGASFPGPLYSVMFDAYGKDSGTLVDYQKVGSGQGQTRLLDRGIDFGASDVPLRDDQLAKAGGRVLHVPVALGAVVVAYNLNGLDGKLNFNGQVLSQIFLGKITRWNDPAIARLNPGVSLPDLTVTPVYRKDESGTTAVFTDYLNKINVRWRSQVGTGLTVPFPVGIGVNGNDQLATIVAGAPGAIGYTELTFAIKNQVAYGAVQNRQGSFIKPTPASMTAAADSVPLPKDNRVSITYAPAPSAYPISSYTYLLVQAEQAYGGHDQTQARALKALLAWMVGDGQRLNVGLQYGALPGAVATRARRTLDQLTFGGKALN